MSTGGDTVACRACGKPTTGRAHYADTAVPLCSQACQAAVHAELQVGCASTSHADLTVRDPALAFRRTMDRLWVDHVHYTRELIQTVVLAPGASAAVSARLHSNQDGIAGALVPFIGAADARAVAALLHAHIDLAVELVGAVRGDLTAVPGIRARWAANAAQIRDFLHAMQGARVRALGGRVKPAWCPDKLLAALVAHLDLTQAEAIALLGGAGRAASAVAAYDRVVAQALELSASLAGGFIHLWPEHFGARRPYGRPYRFAPSGEPIAAGADGGGDEEESIAALLADTAFVAQCVAAAARDDGEAEEEEEGAGAGVGQYLAPYRARRMLRRPLSYRQRRYYDWAGGYPGYYGGYPGYYGGYPSYYGGYGYRPALRAGLPGLTLSLGAAVGDAEDEEEGPIAALIAEAAAFVADCEGHAADAEEGQQEEEAAAVGALRGPPTAAHRPMVRVSRDRARALMSAGSARGRPFTDRQRRYFGWVAGGRRLVSADAGGGDDDGGGDDEEPIEALLADTALVSACEAAAIAEAAEPEEGEEEAAAAMVGAPRRARRAHRMLRRGRAYGFPLARRQRRYYGWAAGYPSYPAYYSYGGPGYYGDPGYYGYRPALYAGIPGLATLSLGAPVDGAEEPLAALLADAALVAACEGAGDEDEAAYGVGAHRGGGGPRLSAAKAHKMLREGHVRGQPLTARQRRYMGWVAGGRKRPEGGRERFEGSREHAVETLAIGAEIRTGPRNKLAHLMLNWLNVEPETLDPAGKALHPRALFLVAGDAPNQWHPVTAEQFALIRTALPVLREIEQSERTVEDHTEPYREAARAGAGAIFYAPYRPGVRIDPAVVFRGASGDYRPILYLHMLAGARLPAHSGLAGAQ